MIDRVDQPEFVKRARFSIEQVGNLRKPKKREIDFQKGDICLYEEGAFLAKCEILDRSYDPGSKQLSVTVKILKVLRVGASTLPEGHVQPLSKIVCDMTMALGSFVWEIREFDEQNLAGCN